MLFSFALNTSTCLYTKWIAWFNKNLLTGRTLCFFFTFSIFALSQMTLWSFIIQENGSQKSVSWTFAFHFSSKDDSFDTKGRIGYCSRHDVIITSTLFTSQFVDWMLTNHEDNCTYQSHFLLVIFFFLCRFYVPMQIECLNIFTRN